MGNYISCALLPNSPGGRNSAVKILLSTTGDVQQVDGAITAAELMLEHPNHFVVNSRALQMGKRFLPLLADEELEMGNLYVMFPMARVNSVVSAEDMAGLFVRVNGEAKKHSAGGGARIVLSPADGYRPDSGGETGLPRLCLEGLEDGSIHRLKRNLTVCRSRKSFLETINEEAIYST